jgi:D-galactarolactone isomerase
MNVAGEALIVPFAAGMEPPIHALPPGATDCHLHIFDSRFRLPDDSQPRYAAANVDSYRLMMRRLGLSRCVIVAPSTYGVDNACLLDALDQFGSAARGVAIVAPDAPMHELRTLGDGGVRGARFYFNKLVRSAEQTMGFARRAADIGWHVELVATPSDRLIANEALIGALPCQVVIDHFGHVPQPDGTAHPASAVLLRLLDKGHVWIKLSAPYRSSVAGAPDFADLDALARTLIAARPDRIVWGTDWPHTGFAAPDPARLVDRITLWTTSQKVRHGILVDNPDALYWS